MANILVSGVIDSFQRTYPKVTDADALTLFKEVYVEVLAICQAEGGTESKNLTDGTREYELTYDPLLLNIREVYYIDSATTRKKLVPVSTDWMDENVSGWRVDTTTGTPSRYYIDAPTSASLTTEGKMVIGLDPIPDTTTSGGYPIITMFGSEYEEPSATSDIPSIFPNVRVFIEGMKRNYASDRGTTEEYLRFSDAFERELTKAQGFINQQIEDLDSPRIVPTWMRNVRVP